MKRKCLPKALRQQVWIKYIGEYYNSKCLINWCSNTINTFNFEVGHNIPFSKGGADNIENLRTICSQCNKSMGNNYTIDEFILLGSDNNANNAKTNKTNKIKKYYNIFLGCFGKK